MGTLRDGTYNGWTNYATWRVNLEIFDGIDPRDMGWDGLDKYDLATVLKDYVEEILESEQAPQRRTQSMPLAYGYALAFLSDVNYREIAEMMISEYANENETETEDA